MLVATIFSILLSSVSGRGALAQPTIPPAATINVSNLIEQAQNLTFAKNRREALRILSEALQNPSVTSKGKARILEAVRGIATMFFTDKGQRLYEAGQTAMFDNPDTALTRYREALAMEDSNLLILGGIIHSLLAKQDCSGALQTIQTARAMSSHLAEPALYELRALICLGNFEGFREKLKQIPTPEKSQEYFLQFLSAQDHVQQKLWKRANELLVRVTEEQPKFPEAYYWLFKARAEADDADTAFARKYVSLCKGLTIRDRKRYSLEPRLCVAMKEVEDELAKKSRDL